MANSQNSEHEDLASSSISRFFSVPELTEDDIYHVFISFSGADSVWVKQLIQRLEETFPSIKICFHHRDFTPGKTIIENMTECIQRSQKIVMVLSPDFVQSRLCTFEANLSMFQDCTSDKTIVPVMLKECEIPFYLRYLTYLEAEDEYFFEKLCDKLLKKNVKEIEILYGGKFLLSLSAIHINKIGNGMLYDTDVPDSLTAAVNDPEIYKEAIQLINRSPVWLTYKYIFALGFLVLYLIAFVTFFPVPSEFALLTQVLNFTFGGISVILLCICYCVIEYLKQHLSEIFAQDKCRKTGEANLLLAETSILAGCASKSSLVFVFVSLTECKDMFHIAFESDTELVNRMWKQAMIRYSSEYATCLANKDFSCGNPRPPGHLVNGICFCQYVAMQIEQGNWP